MTLLLELLFWAAFAWLLYVFVGYPLLFAFLARIFPSPVRKGTGYRPDVTFVMAAYNEEKIIAGRLQNYLDLDYPREKLRFLIGSDSSTDRTDEIIREYQRRDPSIELRRFERSGKTKIVYTLAGEAQSEIIIFSDADILLEPQGLERIAECFADPDVGGVVVRMTYEDDRENAGSIGERTYHGMEDALRRFESLYHTTISPTGPCFAVRRGSYTPLTDYRLSDDLNLVITIPLNGKRVWYEPTAVVREVNRRNLWSEFRRRLLIGRTSMAIFGQYRQTRAPWRSLVGFQVWSHKVLRNFATLPLVLLMLTAIMLGGEGPIYFLAMVLSLIWVGLALVGLVADRIRFDFRFVGYPLYFTMMLVGLTVGSFRALYTGSGQATWSSHRVQ